MQMTVLDLITKLHNMPMQSEIFFDSLKDDKDGLIRLMSIGDVVEIEMPDGGKAVAIFAVDEMPDYRNN